MYIDSWDSFYHQAEELYKKNPLKTRYVTKYRHCDGKLVLKVTDDTVALQYKTQQQADLKKIEKLNQLFFSLMATGEAPADTDMVDSVQQQRRQLANSAKTRRKG